MEDLRTGRRVAILANPIAGRGPRGHVVTDLVDELRRRGLLPEVCPDREELSGLVLSAADSLRCVVAAGGDGTLNEVVNRAAGIPVAVLPLGNQNLLARELGGAGSPAAVADAVLAGASRRLDLGRAHGRYFCLMAGAGIDGEIVRKVHERRETYISKRTYVRPTLEALALYRSPPIDVEITDTGERLRGSTVFVFNLPRYGLGLPIARQALPDDGYLDLWVFERRGVLNLARYLALILAGRHEHSSDVQHRLVQKVRLSSPGQIALQTDGDPSGYLSVDIEVVPGALRVLA